MLFCYLKQYTKHSWINHTNFCYFNCLLFARKDLNFATTTYDCTQYKNFYCLTMMTTLSSSGKTKFRVNWFVILSYNCFTLIIRLLCFIFYHCSPINQFPVNTYLYFKKFTQKQRRSRDQTLIKLFKNVAV